MKVGSQRRTVLDVFNPVAQAAAGQVTRTLNCMLELAFGDKVHSTLRVSGGAKTVTITGQADLDLSRFSGTKTFYAREAIEKYIDDLEDLYLAQAGLAKVRAGRSKPLPLAEVMKAHGLAR